MQFISSPRRVNEEFSRIGFRLSAFAIRKPETRQPEAYPTKGKRQIGSLHIKKLLYIGLIG